VRCGLDRSSAQPLGLLVDLPGPRRSAAPQASIARHPPICRAAATPAHHRAGAGSLEEIPEPTGRSGLWGKHLLERQGGAASEHAGATPSSERDLHGTSQGGPDASCKALVEEIYRQQAWANPTGRWCAARAGLQSTLVHPQLEDAMTDVVRPEDNWWWAHYTPNDSLITQPQGKRAIAAMIRRFSPAKTGANGHAANTSCCLALDGLLGWNLPAQRQPHPCSWSPVCYCRSPVNWPRAGPQPRRRLRSRCGPAPRTRSKSAASGRAGAMGPCPRMPCGRKEQLQLKRPVPLDVRWHSKPCQAGKPAWLASTPPAARALQRSPRDFYDQVGWDPAPPCLRPW